MSTPAPTTDFPDWLSPMVVKELRQGMRTKLFVGIFIVLQVLMTLNVAVGLLTAAGQSNAQASNVVFWVMVAVPVLLVLPLTGMNAVSNEIKMNTLELIFLTPVSAWRIIAGKWLAIVGQAVLLVSAVLPYAVLRYFIGGVNLWQELISLALLLVASAVLTAAAVGFSPYQTRLTRVLVSVGVVIVVQGAIPLAFYSSRSVVGGSSLAGLPLLGAVLVLVGIVLFLMFEFGASKIAPPAEDHSWKKRSLAALLLLLAAGVSFAAANTEWFTLLTGVLILGVCLDALAEQPRLIPSIYHPFARRGVAGRIAGRLLYPGWTSGVFFMLLMLAGFGSLW
ncbi:MAG TPA: hypothetical protein VF614_09505, partial [Chthoniobacteraceae bacterium]